MPSTTAIYNERVKLVASALNLIAIGMVAIGVTTPLVSATYGANITSQLPTIRWEAVMVFWLVLASSMHFFAHLTLGRLLP